MEVLEPPREVAKHAPSGVLRGFLTVGVTVRVSGQRAAGNPNRWSSAPLIACAPRAVIRGLRLQVNLSSNEPRGLWEPSRGTPQGARGRI
jgi:hypothetical protein